MPNLKLVIGKYQNITQPKVGNICLWITAQTKAQKLDYLVSNWSSYNIKDRYFCQINIRSAIYCIEAYQTLVSQAHSDYCISTQFPGSSLIKKCKIDTRHFCSWACRQCIQIYVDGTTYENEILSPQHVAQSQTNLILWDMFEGQKLVFATRF